MAEGDQSPWSSPLFRHASLQMQDPGKKKKLHGAAQRLKVLFLAVPCYLDIDNKIIQAPGPSMEFLETPIQL